MKTWIILFTAVTVAYAFSGQKDPLLGQATAQAPAPFRIEQVVIERLTQVADMHNARDAFSIAGTLAEGCSIIQVGNNGAVLSSNKVNRSEYAARLNGYFRNRPNYTYTCYPLDIESDGHEIRVLMDVLETWTVGGSPVQSGSRQSILFVADSAGHLLARTVRYQLISIEQKEAKMPEEGEPSGKAGK